MDGTTKYINLFGSGGGPNHLEEPFSNVPEVLITHDWGIRPTVAVIDGNLNEIICDVIYESLNAVKIVFSQNQSGIVILN